MLIAVDWNYPRALRKGLPLPGVLLLLGVLFGVVLGALFSDWEFLLVLLSSSVCRMHAFCSSIVLCAFRAAIVSSNSSLTLSGITPAK